MPKFDYVMIFSHENKNQKFRQWIIVGRISDRIDCARPCMPLYFLWETLIPKHKVTWYFFLKKMVMNEQGCSLTCGQEFYQYSSYLIYSFRWTNTPNTWWGIATTGSISKQVFFYWFHFGISIVSKQLLPEKGLLGKTYTKDFSSPMACTCLVSPCMTFPCMTVRPMYDYPAHVWHHPCMTWAPY